MIPSKASRGQPPAWKSAQARAIRDPAELLEELGLDATWLAAARRAAELFPLRVPRGFVARMERGNPADPLLRQVLPLGEEFRQVPGYVTDPLQERDFRDGRGLLQKYEGRVLLTATGACGVHCRYCFRRHFPYAEENPRRDWPAVVDAIAADDSIHEVILSGGDPLTLDTRRLAEMSKALANIPHIRRFRIHSRQPVVLPERVDAELLDWLGSLPWPTTLVIHANHGNEVDATVSAAIADLRGVGVHVLNQAVLLRGINDSEDALVALSEALYAAGALPYYLHLLDRVEGAAHFDVDEETARRLMHDVHSRLPGFLVPRLVREIPGKSGKTLVNL